MDLKSDVKASKSKEFQLLLDGLAGDKGINEKRVTAKKVYDNFFVTNKILTGIKNKSARNMTERFEHLYSLLSREDFIYQAIANIKNNKGTSTPGIDMKTLDAMQNTDVLKLARRLKEKAYRWTPVKRIMIPKPGKSVKRPLGIPSFEDKLVQEMIRMILEAIYEPIFEIKHENCNYGFRPNKSTHMAIVKLYQKCENTEWVIEGDIKGAYDTVVHDRLIEILKEKINDPDLIRLIYQGLKSGIIYKVTYEHTLLGTPQGSIVSPLLFNIYMSKYDEFVEKKMREQVDEWNRLESRQTKPVTRSYRNSENKTSFFKRRLTKIKNLESVNGDLPFKLWNKEVQLMYLEAAKLKKENLKKTKQIPYLNKKKAIIRLVYVRYADDWVIFTNASKDKTQHLKEMASEFLMRDLGLVLSPDKTKITNAKEERVKFLGFSLCYFAKNKKILNIKNKSIRKELFQKDKYTTIANRLKSRTHNKRTTGNQLVIGIDQDRLEFKLATKRFTDEKALRGHRKAEWNVLSDFEIVMRYNYVIRGLINYYSNSIRDFSTLNKYIYLLNYSCYHTLANKHNSSIRKTLKKYGNPIKVSQLDTKGKEKIQTLIGYKEGKLIAKSLANRKVKNSDDSDFLSVRVNWRTTYKLNKYCVICGSEKEVEMHHVKHVRKMGKGEEGFGQVINMLNRRQICVCKVCHRRIHAGLYDGMKLTDLYDPELAVV